MVDIVQSVDRSLSILELISDFDDGLRIIEISDNLGLHKSTVHRLLATLIHKGYVTQDKRTSKYRLTTKLFELGNKVIANIDILKASKIYTEDLMRKFNEVVHLVIRDDNEIIYIDKVEANNTIQMASNIGRRSPLYSTSVGKAILAYMDVDEVKIIWGNSNIKKYTDKTIIDYDILSLELDKIRFQGYAVDDEENEQGVRCVGAPVFNFHGEVEGAISISGPSIRVTKEKIELIADEVKKCAYQISKELGYRQ